jgi:hypothetical protein
VCPKRELDKMEPEVMKLVYRRSPYLLEGNFFNTSIYNLKLQLRIKKHEKGFLETSWTFWFQR